MLRSLVGSEMCIRDSMHACMGYLFEGDQDQLNNLRPLAFCGSCTSSIHTGRGEAGHHLLGHRRVQGPDREDEGGRGAAHAAPREVCGPGYRSPQGSPHVRPPRDREDVARKVWGRGRGERDRETSLICYGAWRGSESKRCIDPRVREIRDASHPFNGGYGQGRAHTHTHTHSLSEGVCIDFSITS